MDLFPCFIYAKRPSKQDCLYCPEQDQAKSPAPKIKLVHNPVANKKYCGLANLTAWPQSQKTISAGVELGKSFKNWDFSMSPIELVYGVGLPSLDRAMYSTLTAYEQSVSIECPPFTTKAYLRVPGNDSLRLSDVVVLHPVSNPIEYKAPANVRTYDVKVVGKCPNNTLMWIIPEVPRSRCMIRRGRK